MLVIFRLKKVRLQFVIAALCLSACKGYHLKKGDYYMSFGNCDMAIAHYEAIRTGSSTNEILIRLAESYEKCEQPDSAISLYNTLFERGISTDKMRLNYAQRLIQKGYFSRASNELYLYCNKYPADYYALMLLSFSNMFKAHPSNLYADYSYFLLRNYSQRDLIFNATSESWISWFYKSYGYKSEWNPSKLKSYIFNNFFLGSIAYTADKTIIFTDPQYVSTSTEQGIYRFKLYTSTIIDDSIGNLIKWSNNDDFNDLHPSLSSDGQMLYFVSDRPGGLGGTDLYFCLKSVSGWTTAANAGNVLNSEYCEILPYIDIDGTLYFIRIINDYPYIFTSSLLNNRWQKPICLNCQSSIPPDSDDLIENRLKHKSADLIISEVQNSTGYGNKSWSLTLKGRAFWKKTGQVIQGASITIVDLINDESFQTVSKLDGKFELTLQKNKSYKLICSSDEALTLTDTLSTYHLKGSTEFYAEYAAEKVSVDEIIVLDSVFYDFDEYSIRPDAERELNKLANLLIDNPQLLIEIGSHTDSRGSFEYNKRLSENRAHEVVNFLISKGVDPARLSWRGYGEAKLLNHCTDGINCTEQEHQLNRRTELRITGIIDQN